jgi:hypothetical protein
MTKASKRSTIESPNKENNSCDGKRYGHDSICFLMTFSGHQASIRQFEHILERTMKLKIPSIIVIRYPIPNL